MNAPWVPEKWIAVACVALGACVSAIFAWGSHFLSNFAFYWGSQLALLALALVFRPRAAVVAGIAFSLAVYLGLFATWVFTRAHPDSMAWLGYVFALPGGAIGAILAAFASRKRAQVERLAVGPLAAGLVAAGIGLNQAVVCSTVMYCGVK